MAEKKTEQVAAPAEAALGASGGSSDPLVHQVLAERETAISNGDDAAVKALTAQLAELGVK